MQERVKGGFIMKRKMGSLTILLAVIGVATAIIATLFGVASGAQFLKFNFSDLKSKLNGREVTIRTFDEESHVIDSISGKSVMIERDTKFDSANSEGGSNKDSSVLKITIGKNEMLHVGSSLIMAEDGLTDVFSEYTKTVNIQNLDRSVPIINCMINSLRNNSTGAAKMILIRSQNGTPLATYLGTHVSTFAVDIPKTTAFLIDDKVLLVYRSDYSVYDLALFN